VPAIARLYERACPGQTANLGTDANRLSAVIERDGQVVAAVLGNYALVSMAILLADPAAAGSDNAAHDAIVALGPLLASLRSASEPGAMIGQVVVLPESLSPLRDAMERSGFRSVTKGAALMAWEVNVPDQTPVATS